MFQKINKQFVIGTPKTIYLSVGVTLATKATVESFVDFLTNVFSSETLKAYFNKH